MADHQGPRYESQGEPPAEVGDLSDSEKAEALADNLETQFQPMTDPSAPAVIEMVDVALRSYLLSPASEPVNHPRRGS